MFSRRLNFILVDTRVCENEEKLSSRWTQFIQLRKEAWKKKKIQDFNGVWTGAPNENIVQNHLNIELLNVF